MYNVKAILPVCQTSIYFIKKGKLNLFSHNKVMILKRKYIKSNLQVFPLVDQCVKKSFS